MPWPCPFSHRIQRNRLHNRLPVTAFAFWSIFHLFVFIFVFDATAFVIYFGQNEIFNFSNKKISFYFFLLFTNWNFFAFSSFKFDAIKSTVTLEEEQNENPIFGWNANCCPFVHLSIFSLFGYLLFVFWCRNEEKHCAQISEGTFKFLLY